MRARLAKVCAHLGGLLSGCPSPAAARPSVVDWLAEHVNIVIAVLIILAVVSFILGMMIYGSGSAVMSGN